MARELTRTVSRRARDEEADERARDRYEEETEHDARRSVSRRDQLDDDDRRRVTRRRGGDEEEEDRSSVRTRARHVAEGGRDRDRETRVRRGADPDDDREARRERRSAGSSRAPAQSTVGRGRASFKQYRESRPKGNYPGKFAIKEGESVLIKFVEGDFFVTYLQHEFFKEFEDEKRQKTFICLGGKEGDANRCPLCAIGSSPRFYALINIIDLRNPNKPELKVWYATPQPGEVIEDEMNALADRRKPILISDESLYYVVSKKKQGNGFTAWSIKAVRSDELLDAYDVDPLTEGEIAQLTEDLYTEDIVHVNDFDKLQEIADELDG